MSRFRWILTGIGLISVIIATITAIITLKAPLEPSVVPIAFVGDEIVAGLNFARLNTLLGL